MTLLAGRSITKSFGSRLILNGADLAVEPEARIGVVGPNGSGKSTLLPFSFLDCVADRIVEVDDRVHTSDGGYSAWLERKTG